jgi:hypothetical protein
VSADSVKHRHPVIKSDYNQVNAVYLRRCRFAIFQFGENGHSGSIVISEVGVPVGAIAKRFVLRLTTSAQGTMFR